MDVMRWWEQILVWFTSFVVAALCECDRDFKAGVDSCLRDLKGFPKLERHKVLVVDDLDKTKLICKWGLVHLSSMRLRTLYAQCPDVDVLRAQCGFQSLEPERLIQYGEFICNHLRALETDLSCIQARTCDLRPCLLDFDLYVPSRVSTGMWKTPKYPPACGYHAHVEHCYHKYMLGHCSNSTDNMFLELLSNIRPDVCYQPQASNLRSQLDNDIYTSTGNNDHRISVLCKMFVAVLIVAVLNVRV